MPQPLSMLSPPRWIVRGRKVRMKLMERMGRLVKGGVVPRPVWYDAALAHPPPLKLRGEKPEELTFPSDELRRTWLRRNPAATMHPKALFLEDESLTAADREHPADVFVDRQEALMKAGMAEEDAYRAVAAEQRREARVRALEEQGESDDAGSTGAPSEPPTARVRRAVTHHAHTRSLSPPARAWQAGARLEQQLLRRFAEEAREQGLPYPAHWFDADGEWRGIGGPAGLEQLEARTRRSLRKYTGQGSEAPSAEEKSVVDAVVGRSPTEPSADGRW